MTDIVNHPPHYNSHPSGVECIQITEHMNFLLGNAIKYIWRADDKGTPVQDLEKAVWYIQRELDRRERLAAEAKTAPLFDDDFFDDYFGPDEEEGYWITPEGEEALQNSGFINLPALPVHQAGDLLFLNVFSKVATSSAEQDVTMTAPAEWDHVISSTLRRHGFEVDGPDDEQPFLGEVPPIVIQGTGGDVVFPAFTGQIRLGDVMPDINPAFRPVALDETGGPIDCCFDDCCD